MADKHEHEYGAAVDLLPVVRENGHRKLTEKLVRLEATVCPTCGEIAVEAEPETKLTRSEWRGIERVAVQTVGVA